MSKLYDAVRTLKGAETEIVGVGRDDLPAFFKDMGYKMGVEIGVAKGGFSEILCKGGLTVFGVDPYIDYPDYHTPDNQARLDKEYDEARERLSKYPNYTLIRKTSMEAAQGFKDESIDFVYIDGHHAFKFITEDLHEWSKKVRKGGCISGHDFVHSPIKDGPFVCHTKHVVRAWTAAYGIKDWYVLGRNHFPTDPNEVRDRWRSWLWLKE